MGFFQGKTVLITGGGKSVLNNGKCGSIGYGIATAYAKEGANLVITGRNVQKLEDAKEELERLYGIKVLALQAGISADADNEAVAQMVIDRTIETFGSLHVLVNNAQSGTAGVPMVSITKEQFDATVISGLYATFFFMKAAYPHLAKTQGSVINFASGAGVFRKWGQAAYGSTKEAIRALSGTAAVEWAKDGVNVNVICPLAWTKQLEDWEASHPEAFKANVKVPPIGHFGDAELEIGRVCVQLATPDFKYMTGETITLEGGGGQRP